MRKLSSIESRTILTGCLVFAAIALASPAAAQDAASYTVDTYKSWLKESDAAKPSFKPGDTLTASDLSRLKPFVPPGYLEQLNFPEFKTQVVAALEQTPGRPYQACTEKYGQQVKLTPEGGLEGYRCGAPFPVAQLQASDPQAGYRAAWNYYWRYLYRGFVDLQFDVVWVKPGNNHSMASFAPPETPPETFIPGLSWSTPFVRSAEVAKAYGGGGLIQRYATAFYARVPFTHLADLDGGSLEVPGAEGVDFKNITWFQSPYDIRGTAFVILRYSDQGRADDAWAYIPNLRRVRRVSAEVKSDSLLGTDITIDDFDGFNDRVLNWNWQFLGWANIFGVNDPTGYTHYYGPNGSVVDDVRSLKRMVATIRTPKNPRHPYSAVINFWHPDSWAPGYQFCFDKRGKLWKVYEWEDKYSETFTPGFWADTMKGAFSVIWWHISCYDVQNHTTTLFRQEGPVMKTFSPDLLTALFDLNSLERVHR